MQKAKNFIVEGFIERIGRMNEDMIPKQKDSSRETKVKKELDQIVHPTITSIYTWTEKWKIR
jgi:hypothetical protein